MRAGVEKMAGEKSYAPAQFAIEAPRDASCYPDPRCRDGGPGGGKQQINCSYGQRDSADRRYLGQVHPSVPVKTSGCGSHVDCGGPRGVWYCM